MRETELYAGPCVLTNCNVWSADSQWVAFDTRSDPSGSRFDGTRICLVNVQTREVRTVYESRNGANCGAVTFHPKEPLVAFILGPEFPTPDYCYGPSKRHGVIVDVHTGNMMSLDARDLSPPFTVGALRGGSHVHVWNATGDRVSFTYEDDIAAPGLRTIGLTMTQSRVSVPKSHPRNHDGGFSYLAVKVVPNPTPGSDELCRAVEEGWVGTNALAFQGFVVPEGGGPAVPEVFIVQLPSGWIAPGDGPLPGTLVELPVPPRGIVPRRLTLTTNGRDPGISGPRHWLRGSPDGRAIAFLKRDDRGIVQLFAVSVDGGEVRAITRGETSVASAFTWHPSGDYLAFVMDHSVCSADVRTGEVTRLTPRTADCPRPEACVISPDGRHVAFVRHRDGQNRICLAKWEQAH